MTAAFVFALLEKRWTGPVVAVLMEHPVHFADLHRAIPGISERMLSDRLTEAGGALEPALKELAARAERHLPEADRGTASFTL